MGCFQLDRKVKHIDYSGYYDASTSYDALLEVLARNCVVCVVQDLAQNIQTKVKAFRNINSFLSKRGNLY